MIDLLPGIFLVLILSVAALVAGRLLSKKIGSTSKLAIVLGCILLICLFRAFVEERLWVARLLPFSSALTVAALSPVFACAAVGFGWELLGPSVWRRLLVSIPLVGVAVFASNRMFFDRRAPTQFDYRSNGWALQTTQASCSPSSAVNLLKHYGIAASESEMVDRCLTTHRGTTRLGLYHGLKQKLADTTFEPRPFWGDVDTLLARAEPAIIFVELKTDKGIDPRYINNWGWRVGLKHVVLYLGRNAENPNEVRIIDPAVGAENWGIDSLRLLFQGEAVELIARE